jgi:hypothetical protein
MLTNEDCFVRSSGDCGNRQMANARYYCLLAMWHLPLQATLPYHLTMKVAIETARLIEALNHAWLVVPD